jgi:hypothetical protein
MSHAKVRNVPDARLTGATIRHDAVDDPTSGVDLSRAPAVGQWYVHARSAHRDAKVIAAYGQLQSETDRLFTLLTGGTHPWTARVAFTLCGRPYESDTELIRAVRANGTLEITSAAAAGERLHPLLGCELGGAFDRFRAVHDLIGHAWCGYGFGLVDECAAWNVQDRLHSGLARRALATEIYGVNAARSIVGEAPELRALLLLPSALLRRPPQDKVSDSHLGSHLLEAYPFVPSGAAEGISA